MKFNSSGVWVYLEESKYQKCATIEYARDLARELNNGAATCKGSTKFNTACGHCVRCVLGDHT